MATAFPSSEDSSSVDIKDVIKCVICKRQLSSQLIQLSCFHACHKSCVMNELRNTRPGSKLSCSECNTHSVVPDNGVDGFEDELLQYKMAEIAKIFANTPPPCNICEAMEEENESSHFCITCNICLCPSDTKRHTVLQDHVITPNAEIQTEQYLSQILTSKKAICSIHSNATSPKILEFYCQDCQVPACQVCSITDHKPHTTISIQDASKNMKQDLKTKARKIPNKIDQCEYVIDKLEQLLNDTDKISKEQIEKCESWGEMVKKAIDKIVTQNVKRIENVAQIRKKELAKIKEGKTYQNNQFRGAKVYMEGFLLYGSESDILQKHRVFTENLQKCLHQEVKIEIDTEAFEVKWKDIKDIEKNLRKMLQVETLNKKHRIDKPQLTGCDLESKWETEGWSHGVAVQGDDVLVVGGEIRVYGITGQSKGKIDCHELKAAGDIEVLSKKLFISNSDKLQRKILVMDRNGTIERTIGSPVQEHGLDQSYRIGLAVDHTNEDVYISSYKTNTIYKCTTEQTQAFPFITTGLNGPRYLCVTPNHEVIVSNSRSHSVCKYSCEGKPVWRYGRQGAGEGELNQPAGVCVDHWDHVFVSDLGNHRIYHLSPEGKFLSFINIGESIQFPYSITFNNEKIIVTSRQPWPLNLHSPSLTHVIKCYYS